MTKATTAPTIRVDIYIAGDHSVGTQACREYCHTVGLCVHIESVVFIYTGGGESGLKIGLINYPRFPTDEASLMDHARSLAEDLLTRLCQHSCCIIGPQSTEWLSRRDAAQ